MRKIVLLFLFSIVFTTIANASTKQGHFKWRNDDGNIVDATARAAEDVDSDIDKNINIRLRIELYESDGSGDDYHSGLGLFYSTNSDPYSDDLEWTRMTTSSSIFQLSLTSYYDESDAINDILIETGGKISRPGFLIESTDTKDFSVNMNSSHEFEYCFKATTNAVYDTTYYFKFMDVNGRIDSYDRLPALTIVSSVDITDPIITSTHDDQNIVADTNCQAVLPDYTGDVVATDNVDTDLTITQSPVAGTVISGPWNMITLTATDDEGNSTNVTFNVAVDATAPIIISIHNDQTVDAGENCQAILPDYTGDIIATDNCDSDLFILQTHAPGKVIWGAYNAITLSVIDNAGNSTHVRFNVAVVDNTAPTIICVGDQIVDPNSIDTYTVSGILFDPVSTDDNCGVASVENDFNNSYTLNGAIFPLGTTTVTWTVTDDAGNATECSFDVTVNGTLGIESLEANGISVYPNPTNAKINFEFEISKTREIRISDLSGRTVLMKIVADRTETIDLSSFDSGIYIISIQDADKTITTRIVKH